MISLKTPIKKRIFGNEHMQQKPNIRPHLLWEYDLETFNWRKSYKIVIERVIQLGTPEDWKEIFSFYTVDQINETIEWSKQLDLRDKNFAKLFLQSDYFHAA
ncbi:MAG: hypothetical protein IPP15_09555 [Saprospiraceae bacterium]|uniref:DUF6922 domain-containing protein n=1 Tax=Candidatus Opimibacter skivensis TaxID=2982028 RepID=A0A9D7SV46_9BACT|nr:hypothetical protein [Candidatus Opimibacter skivensis]